MANTRPPGVTNTVQGRQGGALKKAATDDLEGSDDRNAARKALFQAAAKVAPLKPKAAAPAAAGKPGAPAAPATK